MGVGVSQGDRSGDGSDGLSDGHPGIVSKGAFERLSYALCFLIWIAEVPLVIVVSRALGFRSEGGMIGGLGLLNLILSRLAADRIFGLLGLSRSGKTVEKRARPVSTPEWSAGHDEVVEVHFPKPLVRFRFWGCMLGCVFFGVLLAFRPRLETWTLVLLYVLGGLSGLVVIHIWWDRKPQAWADRDGITGYPTGCHLRRRFVPWSDVAACEIETFYDTFGRPVLIRPVFKGWNGESLMALDLLYTRMEDQERLVKSINAILPRPKDDFWE